LNVALGKAAEGLDYPTIFIYGRVNDVLGYWMSTNEGATWTAIGDYPTGLYDWPAVMEGDMDIHGRLYIGFGGNGFVYHDLDAPLPVSFIDPLWGYEKDGLNLLRWTTGEEINVSHFQIERSVDGKDWKQIGRLPAAGNTTFSQQYKYTDQEAQDGDNYYRIKTIDFDGSYQYSNVIRIHTKLLNDFQLSPNPAKESLSIISELNAANLTIIDINGIVVLTEKLRSNGNVDISNLAEGVYLVRLEGAGGQRASKRLVKMK